MQFYIFFNSEIDLNHFGQYVSSCVPGLLCASLRNTLIETVEDGFYVPRPNLNLTCPRGSFCKNGFKQACAPGYYCDKEKMSVPIKCTKDATQYKTCFGSGNVQPIDCLPGAICQAPYYPPSMFFHPRYTHFSC